MYITRHAAHRFYNRVAPISAPQLINGVLEMLLRANNDCDYLEPALEPVNGYSDENNAYVLQLWCLGCFKRNPKLESLMLILKIEDPNNTQTWVLLTIHTKFTEGCKIKPCTPLFFKHRIRCDD